MWRSISYEVVTGTSEGSCPCKIVGWVFGVTVGTFPSKGGLLPVATIIVIDGWRGTLEAVDFYVEKEPGI